MGIAKRIGHAIGSFGKGATKVVRAILTLITAIQVFRTLRKRWKRATGGRSR